MLWKREGSGYDVVYKLYFRGQVLAEVYKGGNKWYPWSWWVKSTIKLSNGTSTSMRNAKAVAESFINDHGIKEGNSNVNAS